VRVELRGIRSDSWQVNWQVSWQVSWPMSWQVSWQVDSWQPAAKILDFIFKIALYPLNNQVES
jgi:hypothetical protein